jgi:hypothetical protein
VERVVEQTRANFEQLPEGNPVQGVGHKGGQYMFRLKAREEKFWENCQKSDGLQDYYIYFSRFPEGKHAPEVHSHIRMYENLSNFTPSGPMTYSEAPYGPRKLATEERNTPEEQLQELIQKEEKLDSQVSETPSEANKQSQFAKLKKLFLVGRNIFIFHFVVITSTHFLIFFGYIYEFFIFVGIGYVIYQIHGIYISVYSHRVGFRVGTHAGYLLPILTILVLFLFYGLGITAGLAEKVYDVYIPDITHFSVFFISAIFLFSILKFGYGRIQSELQKCGDAKVL